MGGSKHRHFKKWEISCLDLKEDGTCSILPIERNFIYANIEMEKIFV